MFPYPNKLRRKKKWWDFSNLKLPEEEVEISCVFDESRRFIEEINQQHERENWEMLEEKFFHSLEKLLFFFRDQITARPKADRMFHP